LCSPFFVSCLFWLSLKAIPWLACETLDLPILKCLPISFKAFPLYLWQREIFTPLASGWSFLNQAGYSLPGETQSFLEKGKHKNKNGGSGECLAIISSQRGGGCGKRKCLPLPAVLLAGRLTS